MELNFAYMVPRLPYRYYFPNRTRVVMRRTWTEMFIMYILKISGLYSEQFSVHLPVTRPNCRGASHSWGE